MPSPENMNTLKLPNSVELSDSPKDCVPRLSLDCVPNFGSAKGLRPHL
jgi:hypothetical protein